MPPGGFQPARAAAAGNLQGTSALGIQRDQLAPLAAMAGLLLAATGLVWRLRPRL